MKNNNIFLVELKILNKNLNQSFTYMIGSSLYKIINYADLVLVEFNNILVIGMVIKKKIMTEKLAYEIKTVKKILKHQRVTTKQLALVKHLQQQTYNNQEDLLNLVLNKNIVENNQLEIIIKESDSNLNLIEQFQPYYNKEQKILYKKLPKVLQQEVINLLKLEQIDIILQEPILKTVQIFKVKTKVLQAVNKNLTKPINLAKQITQHYYNQRDFLQYYQITPYVFNKLKKLNVLEIQIVNKLNYAGIQAELQLKKLSLSTEQEIAYKTIQESLPHKPALLHGITGSGKTSIFIKLIAQELQKEKQVLILVPEITLTIQMIDSLTNYFGDICTFFNTAVTKNEHQKLLTKIKNQTTKVVIATRSGIFLDIPKLSLVIIDEEHDSSYKQNFYPYYHVDDLVKYWQANKIKVLLSSATPRLISYSKAKKGIYELVSLTTRYNNYSMPEIVLKEYEQDNLINEKFIKIIKKEITKAQNVLILFNVKGYSRAIECPECGNVETCPNCKLPVKYYKNSQCIACNYCEYKIANYTKCSQCQNTKLKLIGLGIEKIQEQIQKYFKHKVLRIDSQIAKTKAKVNEIIKEFNNSTGNILIGTQIIAKGLNFNNLNTVIVLNTDNMLYFNDFSAYETAYQLLEQVSGRSARTKADGKVYIYTNHQDNFIYQAVKEHSYLAFYQQEMQNRKLQKTLPFYYICQIEFRHKKLENYQEQLVNIKLILEKKDLLVTKVVEPYLSKIGEEKRLKLFIKYKKEPITAIIQEVLKQQKLGTCKVLVDLNIMNYGF
ncbi:MAG: primosomal protein N' [Mycoplasmatales bacterium]